MNKINPQTRSTSNSYNKLNLKHWKRHFMLPIVRVFVLNKHCSWNMVFFLVSCPLAWIGSWPHWIRWSRERPRQWAQTPGSSSPPDGTTALDCPAGPVVQHFVHRGLYTWRVGNGISFQKIKRNRLGTVFVIPRKKVLFPRHSKVYGRVNSEGWNGIELQEKNVFWKKILLPQT